jgi:hypothetical protein
MCYLCKKLYSALYGAGGKSTAVKLSASAGVVIVNNHNSCKLSSVDTKVPVGFYTYIHIVALVA